MPEKTEPPTSRKIQEARKEGMVALSQELNAAAAMLIGVWLLSSPGKKVIAELQAMIVETVTSLPSGEVSSVWFTQRIINDLLRVGKDLLLIILGLGLVGVSITLVQTNFLWSSKRITFNLSRLNPLNGFKRLFSLQGLVEWIKALLKLSLIGWVVYAYLRNQLSPLLHLTDLDFNSAVTVWGDIAIQLALRVGAAFLILAFADYAYQRWTYRRSLMMTKEEVKEEMKRSEGDPMIKNRIRGQMRKMLRSIMMANVPKADVIITNPTHLAIAIRYDPETMNAPVVVAKGAYLIAQRIVQIAIANHIPVIQNIPLARALYKTVEIDQEIPPELYVAMAEVLAHVYALRQKVPAAVAS
ncbi:MAG: flagellar biosynthesis protein FlhB [Anaerolineae bacterium]|jgi:flagellar biosynthetic protein FlhB|nr:MAG: flagellar biosynthesis protein FlhB [Anaerolineae bacterium]